jgi:hypothetical protein
MEAERLIGKSVGCGAMPLPHPLHRSAQPMRKAPFPPGPFSLPLVEPLAGEPCEESYQLGLI